MKARYSGLCLKCNQRIEAGEDCDYSSTAKRIFHYVCPENPDLFSESEAEDTAARCHFIRAGDLDDGEAIRARWLLWSLLDGSGSETAGRVGAEAR